MSDEDLFCVARHILSSCANAVSAPRDQREAIAIAIVAVTKLLQARDISSHYSTLCCLLFYLCTCRAGGFISLHKQSAGCRYYCAVGFPVMQTPRAPHGFSELMVRAGAEESTLAYADLRIYFRYSLPDHDTCDVAGTVTPLGLRRTLFYRTESPIALGQFPRDLTRMRRGWERSIPSALQITPSSSTAAIYAPRHQCEAIVITIAIATIARQ
eukprot:IDg23657t1